MMNKKLSILSMEHPAEGFLFRALCLILAILSCLYLYFVAASVLNIIARKEATAHASALQGTIGELEKQYFDLSQSITPQSAAEFGLAPVGKPQYVYRPGNAAVVAIAEGTI